MQDFSSLVCVCSNHPNYHTKGVVLTWDNCGCRYVAACCCEKQGDLRQGFASCETDHLVRVPLAVDAVVETAVLLGQAAVLSPSEAVGQLANCLLRAARLRRGGKGRRCGGVAACC